MAFGLGTLIVDLYVSDLCDRKCFYCQFAPFRRGKLMDLATLNQGLALAGQWEGHIQYQISGTGEPLKNRLLPKIAAKVTQVSRHGSVVLFTSGSASEVEDRILAKVAEVANLPLGDGRYESIQPIFKYDGTEEAAERIIRSFNCHFHCANIMLQVVPGLGDQQLPKFRGIVGKILTDRGFISRTWAEDPDGGPSVHVYSRGREDVCVRVGSILPVGPWSGAKQHVRHQDNEMHWYEGSDYYYWALHPDGMVSYCENSPRGLVSAYDYNKLEDLHRDLQKLWGQFHNKSQNTHPWVCNDCLVHLGTASREAAT